MPTVEHKDIPNADLHEAKGASAATADQLLVAVGDGTATFRSRLVKYSFTLSPAAVNANTSAEQTLAATGLVLATDKVIGISKPTAQAGLAIVGWRVSGNDTLGITFGNFTASPITPTASETYTVVVYRA